VYSPHKPWGAGNNWNTDNQNSLGLSIHFPHFSQPKSQTRSDSPPPSNCFLSTPPHRCRCTPGQRAASLGPAYTGSRRTGGIAWRSLGGKHTHTAFTRRRRHQTTLIRRCLAPHAPFPQREAPSSMVSVSHMERIAKGDCDRVKFQAMPHHTESTVSRTEKACDVGNKCFETTKVGCE
jgi:hypothetical protein